MTSPTGVTGSVPRLRRRADGRLVAGVAGGLAEHLRVPVLAVRIGFVVLAVGFNGLGLLMYAAFWAVVPQQTGEASRPAPGAPAGASADRSRGVGQLVAFAVLTVGAVLLLAQAGLTYRGAVAVPVAVVVAGAALIWRQADETQRSRWQRIVGRSGRRAAAVRLLAGGLLLLAGLASVLATVGDLRFLGDSLVGALVILAGLVVATGPWWWRTWSELAVERRERIRSEERAELAAHLHDSVLHTLALIQRHAADPREVSRLARGQERELRGWLYRATGSPEERFAAALEAAAAEVEDTYAVQVETVVVGDCPVDERLQALVQAAREALVNAGKHAKVHSVSVYAEVEPDEISVFVRDRGVGFDPAAVPDDRHGIAGSIRGRMDRHGGTARVRSAPGDGTEVRLSMRRSPA